MTLYQRTPKKPKGIHVLKDRPQVKGLNDAGNAPCPNCVVLVGQGFGQCFRHLQASL